MVEANPDEFEEGQFKGNPDPKEIKVDAIYTYIVRN